MTEAFPKSPGDGHPAVARSQRALLVCRDAASLKWGPRWLAQAGFEATVTEDPQAAIEIGAALQPALVIIESSLRGPGGEALYRSLHKRHGLPTIVLCANHRDLQAALADDGVKDVIRKPFDWQLISRRAGQIAALHVHTSQLSQMRDALATARTDVTELRQNLERSFETDELTQLPTRQKFRRLLEQTLSSAHDVGSGLAVLVIRLNGFRLVNEALGFESGNRVLVEAANRLRDSLGQRATTGSGLVTAMLGRLGGISFSVAMTSVDDAGQVEAMAARMLARLGQPVAVAGRTIYLSASIGAARFSEDGNSADILLHRAESASLESRQRGGGFQLFREPVASGPRLLHLDTLLHEAIEAGQLHVEYQPILDVAESRVVGAEALLRWNHPREGLISPVEFVPVAERAGLMPRIGAFVIDTACRQLRQWMDAGSGHLRMAINLSLAQLHQDDVVNVVGRSLKAWEVPAHLIEFELSERGVVARDPDVLRQLHLLKSLGLRLAIDDFGTGEASIAYLKDLPIDALKIDRSYVEGAVVNERDATIAAGMTALARRLGLTVIAEGVEVARQLDLLRDWGCHQYQGFYFSPAVSAGRFLPLAARANQRLTAAEGYVWDLA